VKDVTYHLGSGIKVLDLMGNRARVLESQGGQLIPVGPTPLMITTPHRQLWETMMSFRLQNASTRAKVKLQPQSLTWKNVFSEQAKFDVVMNYPQGWEVVPDRTSMEVANATGGTFAYQMAPSPLSPLNLGVPVFLDVEISMPRAHHKVRLYREDTLVSDVELDVSFYKDTEVAGALKCVVAVNLSSEARGASTFIVSAQLPNGEVMETFFKGVMPGDRRQNSLFILDGTALIGKELTLTARENIGQRYLNARFPIQPVF
jgi:hypothetical protein